jgi:hypothetical protein
MARFFGQTIVFGSLTVPIALASAMPQAAAVEEMRQFNDDSKKASTTKSCPKGARYSEKSAAASKRAAVRGRSGAAVPTLAPTPALLL